MPRVTNTTHASTAKHSSYTSSLLNDSHSVLEKIASNTANTNINVGDVEINTQQLEDLTTISNTKLQSIDDRLHNSIGHANNTASMGDGSDKFLTLGLGYDRTNQKVRSILVDSGGKQIVDNPTFDALIGDTNNTSNLSESTSQLRVVPLGYDRSGGKARSLNVDADGHLQLDILSSALPSGGATSANQSTINTSIGSTNTKLDTLETTLTEIATDGNNIQTLITSSNTKLDTLETTLTEIATDGNNIQTLLTALDVVQDNALIKLGEIETSADALISANHTDLVALESSLTSMETKQDTQVTHLSEIEGAIETIEACVSSNKVNVNIASGSATDVSALSTHAKQDTIIGHLDGVEGKLDAIETTNNACQVLLGTIDSDTDAIKTAVEIIDNAIAGSEMQCDIVAALPAGTNNIGVVTANLSSTDNGVLDDISQKIGDVETAVQILDNIVIAEDTAHSSGDSGIMALAVHQTTSSSLGANGDYTPLSVTSTQHLRTAKELYNFSYTFPSSGTIGSGNMAESNVLTFTEKVSNGGYTFFVTSAGTANHEVGIVLKGSMDGSAYFTINSSLYATGLYNDGGTTQYFTIKDFNIKNIKIQITNNSSSSDDFEVFVCH